MWIDLDDEESKAIFIEMTDIEGKPTVKQKIVIPAFDFYSKEVGDGTRKKQINYIFIRNSNCTK